jgi:hypothetical protein
MRHLVVSVMLLGLAGGLFGKGMLPNTLAKQEAKAGWRLLFDGKSLQGWEVHVGGDWVAQDGMIVCPGTTEGWLGTADMFANYDLKLQFRGGERVNSGIFLRSQKEGPPHVTGYELQIGDNATGGYNTGNLVESVIALPTKILADRWNDYDVRVEGDHYVVMLNGKTILNAHDSKHKSVGVIGLQCHKDNKIEFRSFKLLPLGK